MPIQTYRNFAAVTHAAGGQTQTEATATMTDRVLKRFSLGTLELMEADLRTEGSICTTEQEYQVVRAQIVRVRDARIAKQFGRGPVMACSPKCPGVTRQDDLAICACSQFVCGSHSDKHAAECADWAAILETMEAAQ